MRGLPLVVTSCFDTRGICAFFHRAHAEANIGKRPPSVSIDPGLARSTSEQNRDGHTEVCSDSALGPLPMREVMVHTAPRPRGGRMW